MHILGISCHFHDAAAAIVRDGRLIAAAEEERFSRVKHDARFPVHAIRFCLEQAGLTGPDLDAVVFYEKPFLKLERILEMVAATYPRSRRAFTESLTAWFRDRLWIKDTIRRRLGVDPDRILFAEHHLSHAASAYYCSGFPDAAVVTVDGVGEWATATLGEGRGATLTLLRELRFPQSLGLFYSTFTAYLGFEVNDGEPKVMGLAAYGTPRDRDRLARLLRLQPDGAFDLDLDVFTFHRSPERAFGPALEAWFGPPREPGLPFTLAPDAGALAARHRRYADLAAGVQAVTEDALLAIVREAVRLTGRTRLCLAGGVALNSVANGRIARECGLTDLFIQPAAGDAGGAVGAALYAAHMWFGAPRDFAMTHAAWGEAHDGHAIREALVQAGLRWEELPHEDALLSRVVEDLDAGRVVGWCQGRFEWGPRALGQRSLLADPRPAGMRDRVNLAIKEREPFRPLAPSVPAEAAARYFDLPPAAAPARFMLLVAPVRPDQRGRIPAVTHVDGSARPQTVSADHPRYARLLERFGEASGIPILLNTSFNLRGEPIVNTPAEAVTAFLNGGVDRLVLENFYAVRP